VEQYADCIFQRDRKKSLITSMSEARKFINPLWTTMEGKIQVIGGKDFISELNKFMQDKYKVSCSLSAILSQINATEIDEEVQKVIEMLLKAG